MDLLDRVRHTIRRFELARPESRVVAALSGGPDSVGLVHVLQQLDALGELRFVGVAHFNHQLRPAADADERFCAGLAAELSRPFLADREDVAARARTGRISLETAAHDARHLFFERARVHFNADVVALGHTRDDQAETYLLRLVRGAGLAGLASMHPQRGALIRPLLECRRAWIREMLVASGRAFVLDETNDDVTIARNRVRAEILPALERLNPAVVDVLGDEAEIARGAWRLLDDESARASEALVRHDTGDAWRLDAATLNRLPLAIGRMVVHRAMTLAARGRTVPFAHVDAALELSRQTEQQRFDAPGHRVERIGSDVVLTSRPQGLVGRWTRERELDPANFFSYPLSIPGEVAPPSGRWRLSAEEVPAASLAVDAILGNGRVALVSGSRPLGRLSVRNRRPGDRFRPTGLRGNKKLQDFLVDRKVARDERDSLPLVVDELGRILWVAGHAVGEEFRVTKATEPVIVLRLK